MDVPAGATAPIYRDFNLDSTSTAVKSQLKGAKLVDYADTFPNGAAKHVQDAKTFDSDIDDAATLQAKLPAVRAVSTFGDVEKWSCGSDARANYYQRLIEPEDRGYRRALSFRPLMIRKFRDSTSVREIV